MEQDLIAATRAHLDALRSSADALKAERKRCEARIAEIDSCLADMGVAAKPKLGRPRKAKEPKP